MPLEFGESDFVDRDYQAGRKGSPGSAHSYPATATPANRPPTREELDGRVTETHQKLAELKQAQEVLERERAALEEARRRQTEFQTSRQEMIQYLTRGVGLLTEAEFAARREAEQLGKTLAGLQEALGKVHAIRDETWTQDNYQTELTRALTTLENARMEWNSARLKWPVLSGPTASGSPDAPKRSPAEALLAPRQFGELCRLSLALTWPLVTVVLLTGLLLLVVLLRR
jgi:hypothetical protein